MIGVAESTGDNIPTLVPCKTFNIDKDSLQLNNRKCRVSVIKLDRNLIGELFPRTVRLLESSHDVEQRSRNPEVLLLEPKFLTGRDVVIGVQDSGDCLGLLLLTNGPFVVTGVELLEVKLAA